MFQSHTLSKKKKDWWRGQHGCGDLFILSDTHLQCADVIHTVTGPVCWFCAVLWDTLTFNNTQISSWSTSPGVPPHLLLLKKGVTLKCASDVKHVVSFCVVRVDKYMAHQGRPSNGLQKNTQHLTLILYSAFLHNTSAVFKVSLFYLGG